MAKNKKNRTLVPPTAVSSTPSLSFSTQILAWLSLGWALWALYSYWTHFPWLMMAPPAIQLSAAPTQALVFWEDAKAVLLLISVLAGASAFGSYLLRLFRLVWQSPLEEWVCSVGLGLGATGYLILALGVLQLYRPVVFWGLWAVGLVLAWRRWLSGGTAGINHAIQRFNHWHAEHRSWGLMQALLACILGVALLMAFVPEVFYDSMVYHLGVPNWFLFEGGIKYYPAFHAQFPFLRQMLNVLGLALEGERLAKLLHGSSGLLIVATYYALASRYSAPKATLIAALAFFSMPMVNMNIWSAGVDIGLAYFALLAFLAWLNGLTTPELRERWFFLSGVFGGFCFATKYPGLLVPAGICLVTLFGVGLAEKNWKSAVRGSVLIGLVMSVVMVPWLLKDWWMTGNPVYPYLPQIFGGRDLLPDRLLTFTNDTQSGAKHTWMELVISPWTGTLREVSSFSGPGVMFLGFLGFLFVGLLRKTLRTPWYVYGTVFFGLYWFCINSMTDRIRLGIPGLAIGCFLFAHVAAFLYQRSGPFFRMALASVVGVSALAGALSALPTIYYSYAPWDVLLGRESAAEYLSYTHPGLDPSPSMRIMLYAKSVMTPGHRLLIPGDEKASLCLVPFIASGVHNVTPLVQWAREAKTVDDMVQTFKRNRISHMMVNGAEAMRLVPYKIFDWDDHSLALFREFSGKHLRLIHQDVITERYFQNKQTPLFLYEFVETTLSGPPSENVLLEIYQQAHAAH